MAYRIVLTDRVLKAMKPASPGKRVMTWDAVQPHLGIRVTETGAKSFVVVKRMAGGRAPVVHVLGGYLKRTITVVQAWMAWPARVAGRYRQFALA